MGKSYLKLVPLRQIHWKLNNGHFPHGETEHTKQRKEANFPLVLFKVFCVSMGTNKKQTFMLTICYYIYYFMFWAILLECLSVWLSVCLYTMRVHFFGGIRSSRTEVTNACELPCGCRESNLGPLENQPVLLALGSLFSSNTFTYCIHSMCVYVRRIYRVQCEGR